MGKKKLQQYSLLSGLAVASFAATQVAADEVTDVNTNTAGTDQTTEVAQSGPQVKVIDQTTEGNTTTTTSEVTSPELNSAVASVNSYNETNNQSGKVDQDSNNNSGKQDANSTNSSVVVPPVTITENETKVYDTVEEADAANKVQAEAIQNTLDQYQKDVADYKEKLANYNAAQEKYIADKAAYDEKVKAYNDYQEKVKALVSPENAEVVKGLIYNNEPNAVVTIDGVDQYVTKEAQEQHVQDEILQQFNTDKYPEEDFTSENPYASTEDAWFKMNVGDTVTATYTNLENSDYLGTKITKAVATYTLIDTTSDDGTAIAKLYHDPTKTIFIGAQTSDDASKKIQVDIHIKFYDENGNLINLSDNNSVLSLSSLNHWTTEYGDHVEKVLNIGDSKFVKFNDSSINLNADGAIYSPTENQYVANGAEINGDGEDGWDKINNDGEKRTASSVYGAAAMTYSGEPFTISAEGNNAEVPTAIWFAVNSFATQEPGPAPEEPEMPKLSAVSVNYNKAIVRTTATTPEEPETPTPETPEEPETPTPETPEEPTTPPETPTTPTTPTAPEVPATPKAPTPEKTTVATAKSETPAPSQEPAKAQALPSTGETNSYGVAAFGAGIVAFSALTLLGSRKRKED
ncbi:GbpC/Spa domain-containing protein [Streptococcus dentapri]|uniref:GbpC/Spa domain-containing protein n=1 Tax=Streptococcus dentapri TaxID=573564 RepID=A0ABV8D340_9STRE